jgi:ribosome-binding protein aMBF1 (putative translation factor)
MLIEPYFKQKRIEKGLSETELALQISSDFQESLLWDFEAGDDTDIDGWSIQDFKKYCDILEIDPTALADIPVSNMLDLSLAALVRTRGNEMGYSISELSDIIGFEEKVIRAIEEERRDVVVALHVLKQLSVTLGIPFKVLLQKI